MGKAASGDQEHEATLANLGWAVLADFVAAKAVGIVAKWIRGRLIVEGADGRTVEFTKEAIEEARARLKNSGLAGTDEEVEWYVLQSLETGEDAGDLAKAGNRVAEGIAPIRTITDAVRHRAGNRQILAGNQRWHLPKDTPTSHIPIADPVGDQLQSAASQAAQRWNRTFLSPNEAAAIRQAHVDGKHWLGNLLERQARGRWVEGQVQQQFPQLNWSRTGADVVDPATGITYDILSATRHNMDLHAQRMANVLFRMITF